MHFEIPGQPPLDIETIILDLNGTLTIDGKLIDGVRERIQALLAEKLRLVLFTGDTHGNGAVIAKELGIELRCTPTAEAKAAEARTLRPETCATIGNGRIDLDLFRTVRLPIAVIQAEGAFTETVNTSLVQFTSVNDALDSFLKRLRLVATCRK